MLDLTQGFASNGLSLISTANPLVGETFDWSLGRTLYSYVLKWAAAAPDKIAAVDVNDETTTYAKLLARTNQRASQLQALGALGRFVMSQRSRGVECLIDILACNAVGAIYIPVDPLWPDARRAHIRMLTDAVVILTDEDRTAAGAAEPTHLDLRESVEDPFNAPCYCLFTSGSTGMPKGAIVAQMGMMNHLNTKVHLLNLESDSVVAQTAPTTFDVAIWQFCAALLAGGTVRVVANEAAQDPHELVRLLSDEGITHIELVPTVLREFLHEAGLDHCFPALRHMLVTGEELPLRLAKDWVSRFPGVPLINAYGPTECADDVTHGIIDAASLASGTVPIGLPIPNIALYVLKLVDGVWLPVSSGTQGELFVAGPCVGLGYVSEPGKTAEAFAQVEGYPFRLYRTGDIVRQRPDGQLIYEGRVDRQVKISGVRIEPSEIENQLLRETHDLETVAVVKYRPLVREDRAIVLRETTHNFVREGDARLAAFYLPRTGQDVTPDRLDVLARASLPGPMRPSRWFELTEVPTTPNGKVDIKLLERRAVELSDTEHTAPGRLQAGPLFTEGQFDGRFFLAVAEEVLGHPVDPSMTFVEAGGDSLRAIQLANTLRSWGCTVRVSTLLSGQTLNEIVAENQQQWVAQVGGTTREAPVVATGPTQLPLTCDMSSAQQGIYFQWLLEPESAYYNYQVLLECPDGLDMERTRRALALTLRANPQLMAQFAVDSDGRFRQTFPVTPIDMAEVPVQEVASVSEARALCRVRAAVPFDLEAGRSIDMEIVHIRDGATWFVLTMNEILIDGWGAMKLMEQLAGFYRSEDLAEQEKSIDSAVASVVDYFRHLGKPTELTPEARDFWKRSLDGACQDSPLRDTEDSSCDPYAASIMEVSLDEGVTEAIRSTSRTLQTSPFAVFMAAYALALAAVSGQDDFVIGAPVASRDQGNGVDVPTLMLNMVAIRSQVERGEPIVSTVRRLVSSATAATSFGDSPFSAVVSEFATHSNDDPLFSTMVNMLTYPTSEAWVGAESLRLVELDTGFTKYDASLYVQRHGDDYTLQIAHKLAHVTPKRARTVLALTSWFLTSDWLSEQTTVAEAISAALEGCAASTITTLHVAGDDTEGEAHVHIA